MLEESTGNFSASRNVYDWYQTNTHVNINIMIKNLTESDVKVRLIDETLDVSCNLADGSEFKLHFNLFKSIFVSESSWTVTPSKLEIKLKKSDRKRWQSLEVIPEKGTKRSPSSHASAGSPSASTPKRFMSTCAGQSACCLSMACRDRDREPISSSSPSRVSDIYAVTCSRTHACSCFQTFPSRFLLLPSPLALPPL